MIETLQQPAETAVQLDCPHCGSKGVHRNPRNARMYFCEGCVMPSLHETHDGVTGLRPITRADHGRYLNGIDRMAWFMWATGCITAARTSRIR